MTTDFAAYSARLLALTKGEDPVRLQSETVETLKGLTAGVPLEVLQRRPRPGKWSVVEILAHLADVEQVSSWRYRQILEHDGVPIAAYDQNLWAEWGDYSSWDPATSLTQLALLRATNLRLFRGLSSAQWQHRGVHAERGPLTLAEFTRQIAGHDLSHIDQIRAILGTAPTA